VSAKDDARAFRVWAIENGLLSKERLSNEEQVVVEVGGIQPLSESTPTILHKRGITLIGYNETDHQVVVFTAKRLTKKDKQHLPTDAPGGSAIVYENGAIGSVGGPPVSVYGTVPYALVGARYSCGSSIFVGNRIDAGTLGCLVRDAQGVLYGLTNNHVTGSCNFSDPGLPVVAPGPADIAAGALDPFCLGHHEKVIPMIDGTPDNVAIGANTDAAIFRIKDPDRVSSMQRDCYDTPAAVGTLQDNMVVEKVGRTTGRTAGILRAISSGAEPIQYQFDMAGKGTIRKFVYYDPIYVIKPNPNTIFSDGGDSGSLVTTLDGNARLAVGIVVAGDPQRRWSFILPIKPILDELGLTLVSGFNGP
jgi:hypothetical protein